MVIAEDEIVDRFQLKSVIVPVKIRNEGKKIGEPGVIVLDYVRYRLTHGPDETAEIIARRSVDRGQEK